MRTQTTLHKYIGSLFKIKYKLELPSYSGSYFISPRPPYLSQFIGIYPSSITPKTPLTNKQHIKTFGAKDSKEFTFWSWRNCGIACVKMILSTREKAFSKSIMNLTNEGVRLGGYILYDNGKFVDKGWFHQSLVSLLKQNGVFAKTRRWQSIDSVAKDILENKMIILSVSVPGRCFIVEDGSFGQKEPNKTGGHLVLATGIKMNGKSIEGLYIHDPRGLDKYQENTFIPKNIFNKIFTGRTIVTN